MSNEVVRDPKVLARLPRAGYRVEWQWSAWRLTRTGFMRSRHANARVFFLGPLFVCIPAPWLLGPARALHPEVFDELWVCGKHRGVDPEGNPAWDLQGVFDSEAAAVAACKEPSDFVGPVLLNQQLPQQATEWPGCRFPLAH